MLRCTPFLLFDGNCAEAMRFYHECIGGNLVLTRLGGGRRREPQPNAMEDAGDVCDAKRGGDQGAWAHSRFGMSASIPAMGTRLEAGCRTTTFMRGSAQLKASCLEGHPRQVFRDRYRRLPPTSIVARANARRFCKTGIALAAAGLVARLRSARSTASSPRFAPTRVDTCASAL
jgi:uncharacterized glyoxalase superfamily protein PhnB